MRFLTGIKLNPDYTCDDYPYNIFNHMAIKELKLEDITILYKNNGCGKTTVLNMIGELIACERKRPVFKDICYVDFGFKRCFFEEVEQKCYPIPALDKNGYKIPFPRICHFVTSDDIFQYMEAKTIHNNKALYDVKCANDEQSKLKKEGYYLRGIEDSEHLHKYMEAKKLSGPQYTKKHSEKKINILSNGETALEYYSNIIEPNGFYLLDEPENCLSPIYQIELMKIIDYARRGENCQFVIATHSPIIMSLNNSLIYDLDASPAITRKWEELENVKIYFDFFYQNRKLFGK